MSLQLPGGQPVSKEDDEVEICNNVVEVTEPAPDGGLIAWSQVLVSHLLVVNGFGYISSFGLFESYWVTELDRSASAVSWVGSMQMFLLFFIGTLSGRAMDAGFFRSLIYAGCSLQLLGTFTTSACTQYWQLFLSQGIVQGLGNGFLFTPAVALVSTYFARKRAFALGFAACGAPVGGMIFPVVRLSSSHSLLQLQTCPPSHIHTLYFRDQADKSGRLDCAPTRAYRWFCLGNARDGFCDAVQYCYHRSAGSTTSCVADQRTDSGVERLP